MKRRDFLGHTGVASLPLGLAGSTSAADSAQPSADETRLAANVDVGDAWEFADVPYYPEKMTALAYRYGINYIVYAMTH